MHSTIDTEMTGTLELAPYPFSRGKVFPVASASSAMPVFQLKVDYVGGRRFFGYRDRGFTTGSQTEHAHTVVDLECNVVSEKNARKRHARLQMTHTRTYTTSEVRS